MDNPNRNRFIPREADGSLYPWWCYVALYGTLLLIVVWLGGVVLAAL